MMGLIGVLVNFGIPVKTHLEVLVYQTRVTPQVYMVYVVPRDASVVQAVKEEMKRLAPDARRIIITQPCIPLWLNTKLRLKTSAPDSRISPLAFTLRYTRIPPYFEVVIRNAGSSFDLELVSEGQSIWKATLWDHEYEIVGHTVEEADDIREDETSWLKRDRPNGEKEEATLQDIVGDEVEESNAIRKVKAWLQLDDIMPGNYGTHLSDKAKHDSAKSDSGYGSSRGKSVMSGPQSEDGAVGGGDLCEVSSVYSQGISDIVSEVPSEEDWVESGPQSTVEPPMICIFEDENQDHEELMPIQEATDCSTGTSPSQYDRPSNCCKSCEDIEDSSEWTPMTPVVSMATGVLVYTHSSFPGRFECTVSSLRWVCEKNVTLQYYFSDPDIFTEELVKLQYTPIGPLMNIKVMSGELLEAHLPHFACLDGSDSTLKEAVKILHAVDGERHLESCELTRFHAKLTNPSFSDIQVLVKDGELEKIHLDVLIYQTRVTPLVFLTYVVPRDPSMIEVVEKEIEKDVPKARQIKKHRPGISLQPHSSCSLKATCAATFLARISPECFPLEYIRPPHVFEVVIKNVQDCFDLELVSEERSIWKATFESFEYEEIVPDSHSMSLAASGHTTERIGVEEGPSTSMASRKRKRKMAIPSGEDELKRVRHDFIARTNAGVLGDLVSRLKSHDPPVLNNSEANVILQSSSVLRDQATTLIDMVLNKGNKACAVMLSLLKELDSFLCEDLGLDMEHVMHQ